MIYTIKLTFKALKDVLKNAQFIENQKKFSNFRIKISMQTIIALGFLLLTFANILVKSYYMLVLTAVGFAVNIMFALLSIKFNNGKLCSCSSIMTCSVLFVSFVICGGNDGFACLWVILLPLISMIVMDFKFGIAISIFFQIFLIAVFWTPLNKILLYEYNQQFCLRFPLFFFVTFILGLLVTVSLRQAEYNELQHLVELEKMNKQALLMSRIDPLTKLANRRFAYEEFDTKYTTAGIKHCIVMGDIDGFKLINDQYGHALGDTVLTTISELITEILPDDYLKSRWGGEEFLFAANDSPEKVHFAVERLRKAISAYSFNNNSSVIHITMTFGIAEYNDNSDIAEAIKHADKCLYIGKNSGKNCTIME